MANTEVLLIKPVDNLGAEGDKVKVRAGYARNFLLPRSLAMPVTHANEKRLAALKAARERREAEERSEADKLADKLNSTTIAFAVKTGEGGKMYGSITAAAIADRLKEEGIEIDRRKINLHDGPIKELGKHEVTIKLYYDMDVTFGFEVVSENPIEETEHTTEASAEEDSE